MAYIKSILNCQIRNGFLSRSKLFQVVAFLILFRPSCIAIFASTRTYKKGMPYLMVIFLAFPLDTQLYFSYFQSARGSVVVVARNLSKLEVRRTIENG
jgi:hypothetical protein